MEAGCPAHVCCGPDAAPASAPSIKNRLDHKNSPPAFLLLSFLPSRLVDLMADRSHAWFCKMPFIQRSTDPHAEATRNSKLPL
jgi:hypothetical protein